MVACCEDAYMPTDWCFFACSHGLAFQPPSSTEHPALNITSSPHHTGALVGRASTHAVG